MKVLDQVIGFSTTVALIKQVKSLFKVRAGNCLQSSGETTFLLRLRADTC